MLTEARERAVERQGLESGADAYISKSAEQELIILRIKALCAGARLPRRSREERQSPSFGTFRRACILIVDDSPTRRTYLQNMLTHEGYAVTPVSEPAEAPPASSYADTLGLRSGQPAQPGFDGIELCRQLNLYRGLAPCRARMPPTAIVGLGNEEGEDARARLCRRHDIVPSTAEADVMRVRIRALVRRKLMQDENWRIEAELSGAGPCRELQAEGSLRKPWPRPTASWRGANDLLKGTQAQLVQAAKMASLGELVAGIAHEINNPLAFIQAHQGTVAKSWAKSPQSSRWA